MPASKTLHRRLTSLEERVAEQSQSTIFVKFIDGDGIVVSTLRIDEETVRRSRRPLDHGMPCQSNSDLSAEQSEVRRFLTLLGHSVQSRSCGCL